MYFFLQIALSGIATGAIYGLIAVGYSLTFMTTKALNFALGMWVMLGGMLSLFVQCPIRHSSSIRSADRHDLAIPARNRRRTIFGLSVFAGGQRRLGNEYARGRILLIDFAEIIWGRNPTPVPPFFGKDPVYFGSVSILPQQLLIIAAACVTFVGLDFFYRRTLPGKAFRAVSHSGDVSSLMGINTRRIEALSYAVAAALAGSPVSSLCR